MIIHRVRLELWRRVERGYRCHCFPTKLRDHCCWRLARRRLRQARKEPRPGNSMGEALCPEAEARQENPRWTEAKAQTWADPNWPGRKSEQLRLAERWVRPIPAARTHATAPPPRGPTACQSATPLRSLVT